MHAQALLAVLSILCASVHAAPVGFETVSYEAILSAMRSRTGYNAAVTTNAGRFQAEVLLTLAESAEKNGIGRPLFVGHAEWFDAILTASGLSRERAPLHSRLAYENRQDIAVEHRTDRVVERVVKGPHLVRALAVVVAWPDAPDRPRSYSYEDLMARPTLQVTNHRIIRYRLLQFVDRVVIDTIEGLTGRPSSGALGLLFKLIGEGRVVEYRMGVAADGVQVSRGRACKALFEVSSTLTVEPDGRAEKDVPAGRADLRALEQTLREPLEVRYRSFGLGLYPGGS